MVLWGWGPAAVGIELVIFHPVIKGPVLSRLPHHPFAVPLIFPFPALSSLLQSGPRATRHEL